MGSLPCKHAAKSHQQPGKQEYISMAREGKERGGKSRRKKIEERTHPASLAPPSCPDDQGFSSTHLQPSSHICWVLKGGWLHGWTLLLPLPLPLLRYRCLQSCSSYPTQQERKEGRKEGRRAFPSSSPPHFFLSLSQSPSLSEVSSRKIALLLDPINF